MPVFREFAGLECWDERLPDESTILRSRQVLEKHKLAVQILRAVNDLLGAKAVTPQERPGGGRHPDRCAQLDPEQQR